MAPLQQLTRPLHRLKKDQVPISKVACFGSDGASQMLGHKSGVAAALHSRNELMLSFHCVCHREALASKAAASEISYLNNTFFAVTEQLGRFLHDSSKRTQEFETAQVEEGLVAIKLIKSAFTRWLSHDAVTKSIHVRFIPLLKFLFQNSEVDVTAGGLFANMCTQEYVAFLLVMRDVLPLLCH
eukprot:Pompholyxophrys_punicea_v1_NODE_369_length_2134_cov_3.138047.p1 type:complete len:184 gc:universal NODE_369_length_2134_cov_3.138047:1021-1572(+)